MDKEAFTLTAELQVFKCRLISSVTTPTATTRACGKNPHDDLVLAVALAAWYGENYRPVVNNTPPSLSFRGSRYRK
jgi:hypothetical protein